MTDSPNTTTQIQHVTNFQDLVSTRFWGAQNAACWERVLVGDFAEIVNKVTLTENMAVLEEDELLALVLSEQGQLARGMLLNDMQLLKTYGAAPTLNLIRCYESDDSSPFFPTDVYSFHVDQSPVPTDTFLCTYYGEPSEILPNAQAIQKVMVPDIRQKLYNMYGGADEGFESFLKEYFFDLHYQPLPIAKPISLVIGNLWKLAVSHPNSESLPCIHRAPIEKNGQTRLLLIC